MNIFSYKLINLGNSIRLGIDNDSNNNFSTKTDKRSFEEITQDLDKYLMYSNDVYGDWENNHCNKKSYRDYIYRIIELLSQVDIPPYYLPFQNYNLFNNLLDSFKRINLLDCYANQAENVEKDIIKLSALLLYILSYYQDCCDYLNDNEFFEIINMFLRPKGDKFRKAPKIQIEYSDNLIRTFANFAVYKKFHGKFTPIMFQYALNQFYQTDDTKYFKAPLIFFYNYFYLCDNLPEGFKSSNLVKDIVNALGSYPCGNNFDKNQPDNDYKKLIHYYSSGIIYILTRLGCLPIQQFFNSNIHIFIKKYYLTYEYLMATIGYFAIFYQDSFNKLEISLDDICRGFEKENDQKYLQCTFLTVYNTISHSQRKDEMLSSNIIPNIISFIVDGFEKNDYSTKLYSFVLLCYIYSEMQSLYMKNVSIVLFLLENCSLFISESEDMENNDINIINNLIFKFLYALHSFLVKFGNTKEASVLVSAFNRCLEELQIPDMPPFIIPPNAK